MVDSALPVVRLHIWIPVTVVVAPREIVRAIVGLGGHLDHVRIPSIVCVAHLVDLERHDRFLDGRLAPNFRCTGRVAGNRFWLSDLLAQVLDCQSQELSVFRLTLTVSLVSFFSLLHRCFCLWLIHFIFNQDLFVLA